MKKCDYVINVNCLRQSSANSIKCKLIRRTTILAKTDCNSFGAWLLWKSRCGGAGCMSDIECIEGPDEDFGWEGSIPGLFRHLGAVIGWDDEFYQMGGQYQVEVDIPPSLLILEISVLPKLQPSRIICVMAGDGRRNQNLASCVAGMFTLRVAILW